MNVFKFCNCRRPMIYNIESCKSFAKQCIDPYIINNDEFYYEIVRGCSTKYKRIGEWTSLEIETYGADETASLVWKYRKQINDHFR